MKKIFYNKRKRLPVWSQIYIVWAILAVIISLWVFKFEIYSEQESAGVKYSYKNYQEILNLGYSSVSRITGGIQDFSEDKVGRLTGIFAPSGWDVKGEKIKVHRAECSITRFAARNKSADLVVLFDNNGTGTSGAISAFASSLMRENLTNVTAYAVKGSAVCNDYVLENSIASKESAPNYPRAVILVYPSQTKESGIQTSFLHGSSALAWNKLIPANERRPDLKEQVSQQIFPYFQRIFIHKKNLNFDMIGWYFPENIYSNELENVNFVMPGILYVARSIREIEFGKNLYWLGESKSISRNGIFLISLVLVMLIWLPVANRLYQKEAARNIFQALFSALFNGFLLFIMLGAIRVFSYVFPEGILGPAVVLVTGLALFIIFNKVYKKTLNVQVNSLTEFLVLVVFGSIMAFTNFGLFLAFVPFIFLSNRKMEMGTAVFRLFLFLLILPAFYLLLSLVNQYGLSESLSLLILDKVYFTHLYQTIIFILFTGSFIAIIRDPS